MIDLWANRSPCMWRIRTVWQKCLGCWWLFWVCAVNVAVFSNSSHERSPPNNRLTTTTTTTTTAMTCHDLYKEGAASFVRTTFRLILNELWAYYLGPTRKQLYQQQQQLLLSETVFEIRRLSSVTARTLDLWSRGRWLSTVCGQINHLDK